MPSTHIHHLSLKVFLLLLIIIICLLSFYCLDDTLVAHRFIKESDWISSCLYIIWQHSTWTDMTLGVLSLYITLAYILRVLTEPPASHMLLSHLNEIPLNRGPLLLFTIPLNTVSRLQTNLQAVGI